MNTALAWLMASRWRAAGMVLVFAVLPLTGIVAAAILALVVLRHGVAEGLTVAAIAGAGMAALHAALGGSLLAVGSVVLITWIPVLVMAAVLRLSSSQARVLALAGIFGCGAVVGIFAAAGDPAAVWEQIIREQLLPLMDQAGVSYDRERLLPALPAMAALMTGLAAAFWAVGHFLTVALARWAQAALVNPGGFRTEFHALRLGLPAVAVGGVVFIASALTDQPLAVNLALVLVIVFAVQGVAVMHGVVAGAGLHWAWLVPPYVFATVLPPHMLAMFAVMGFVDYWVDFRRRFRAPT